MRNRAKLIQGQNKHIQIMYRRPRKGFTMPLRLAEECRTMCNAGQAGRNGKHWVYIRFGTLALGTFRQLKIQHFVHSFEITDNTCAVTCSCSIGQHATLLNQVSHCLQITCAHKAPISALALNSTVMVLTTATEKGTVLSLMSSVCEASVNMQGLLVQ